MSSVGYDAFHSDPIVFPSFNPSRFAFVEFAVSSTNIFYLPLFPTDTSLKIATEA